METQTTLKPGVPYFFPRVTKDNRDAEGDPIEITVGMEATLGVGSDRYPYEVIEIRDAKTVILRAMSYQALKQVEYGDTPPYLYLPNPDGEVVYARLVNRRGRRFWGSARPGDGPRSWNVSDCSRFYFGKARFYYDPSF